MSHMTTQADADLTQAIELASQPNYLGDPVVVDSILIKLAKEIMHRWKSNPADREAAFALDLALCERTALIFLGRDEAYTAMPAWNKVGLIDEFLCEMFEIDDADPVHRVSWVLLDFLQRVLELIGAVEKIDEAYFEALGEIVLKYRQLLMGIVPPTVTLTNEDNVAANVA